MARDVKGNDNFKYVEVADILICETYRLAYFLEETGKIAGLDEAGTMRVILTPDFHEVNDHVQSNCQLIAVLISHSYTQVRLKDHSHQHVDKYKEVNQDKADPEEPR